MSATILGPSVKCMIVRQMEERDLEAVRALDCSVWTELARRVHGRDITLPFRSQTNINYYYHKDPGGAVVAEDAGSIIGYAFSHTWGSVGWTGPLGVDFRYHARGIGKSLVNRSAKYLETKECRVVALETMPENLVNLAMYFKLGYKPSHLALRFNRKLEGPKLRPVAQNIEVLRNSAKWYQHQEDIDTIANEIIPGLNYSSEFAAAEKYALGPTITLHGEKRPAEGGEADRQPPSGLDAFALLHTYRLREGAPNALVKILAARPGVGIETFDALLAACEVEALKAGCQRLLVSVYSRQWAMVQHLLNSDYVLSNSNVRMTLRGNEELARAEDKNVNNIYSDAWTG